MHQKPYVVNNTIDMLNKAFFIRPDKYIATITRADNYESIYDLIDEFKIKLD